MPTPTPTPTQTEHRDGHGHTDARTRTWIRTQSYRRTYLVRRSNSSHCTASAWSQQQQHSHDSSTSDSVTRNAHALQYLVLHLQQGFLRGANLAGAHVLALREGAELPVHRRVQLRLWQSPRSVRRCRTAGRDASCRKVGRKQRESASEGCTENKLRMGQEGGEEGMK